MGDDLLGVIDLAIAIQLVTEQVEQHEVRRLELGQNAHGVELVAFKNAHALAAGGTLEAAARLEQCAHHARPWRLRTERSPQRAISLEVQARDERKFMKPFLT